MDGTINAVSIPDERTYIICSSLHLGLEYSNLLAVNNHKIVTAFIFVFAVHAWRWSRMDTQDVSLHWRGCVWIWSC